MLLRGVVGLRLLLRLSMLRWCRRFRRIREILDLFEKLVRVWVVAAVLALCPVEVSSFMRLQVRAKESLDHLSDMCLGHLSWIHIIHPWVLHVLPASAAVAPLVTASSSSCPLASCVAGAVHARRTVTPMHALNANNSWSDTGRVKGPTGRRSSKGGVSGPAEDLRPVSEVEAGVNFRPAGGEREQVAGSLPRRQPGTGTRQVRGGAVTPSLHPEVPGLQFVSPGYGLDIRQSMGWTKVCGTA